MQLCFKSFSIATLLHMNNSQPITQNAPPKEKVLSGLGMTASMACAVHCAATPLILAFLPMSGEAMDHSGFHALEPIMILLGAGLGLYFLLKTGKKSKFFLPRLSLLLAGLGFLLTSTLFEGHFVHTLMSVSGALMMATSQFRPFFREKGDTCPCGTACNH